MITTAIESTKIVMLCILAAVVYGILHDQVTARVCVEYFTIGHPPVFPTASHTLLAIGWGIIATWWVGFILGIPAAICCRAGSWPKFTAQDIAKPIFWLLIAMGLSSLIVGVVCYFAAANGMIHLTGRLAHLIPAAKENAFLADWGAHLAAYGVGAIGGAFTCVLVLLQRRRLAKNLIEPQPT